MGPLFPEADLQRKTIDFIVTALLARDEAAAVDMLNRADCTTATRGYPSWEGQMWLTGRLVPDHKTMGDFLKDNGAAICNVCARFIMLCWALDLSLHAARPRATR